MLVVARGAAADGEYSARCKGTRLRSRGNSCKRGQHMVGQLVKGFLPPDRRSRLGKGCDACRAVAYV